MSYIKLGQIMDFETSGGLYLEDNYRNIIADNINIFPIELSIEVISWVSEEEYIKHGKIDSFNVEKIQLTGKIIPIRQFVYNELISKYSDLVM